MEEKQVAPAGLFSWNEECSDSGQVGKGNMRKSGWTDKGRQRYQCKKRMENPRAESGLIRSFDRSYIQECVFRHMTFGGLPCIL